MRILYAVQMLRAGGAERIVVSLAQSAERAGHEAAVVAAPGSLERELSRPAFPLPLVERRPWRLVGAALALDRAVRVWRPDVVHAHNPGMALITALATLGGRRVRSLVTVHGVADEDYRPAARLLRLARLPVTACGPGVAVALREHGLDVQATIINGVPPPPPPADRAALEREWQLEPGRPLVVSVGRLMPQKNHELAIRALARVPEALLVVVGEGPRLEELHRCARLAGVQERIRFAGVRVDASAVIGAADAVVLPSKWEGLPLVALEAFAAGTPLVATAVRGVRELVVDGVSGVLVPPEDADGLANALRRVLADEALRARVIAGGRELAERHSEAHMLESYLSLYEKLLDGHAA